MINRKWISCDTCDSDDFSELSVVSGWRIEYCDKYSMRHLIPVPFFEPSQKLSNHSMGIQYTQYKHEPTQNSLDYDKKQFRPNDGIISEFTGHCITPGKLLDVGYGEDLAVSSTVKTGKDKLKVDVYNIQIVESELQVFI